MHLIFCYIYVVMLVPEDRATVFRCLTGEEIILNFKRAQKMFRKHLYLPIGNKAAEL
jgi:hypothetical protein